MHRKGCRGSPPPAGAGARTGGSWDCLTGSRLLGNPRRLITAATVINQKIKKKKRRRRKGKRERKKVRKEKQGESGKMKVKQMI